MSGIRLANVHQSKNPSTVNNNLESVECVTNNSTFYEMKLSIEIRRFHIGEAQMNLVDIHLLNIVLPTIIQLIMSNNFWMIFQIHSSSYMLLSID